MVDIPRCKALGIYLTLFTDREGDSCFSIYQIEKSNVLHLKKGTIL